MFGVRETTANDIFHYWLSILNELLPASLLEQVKKNESDYELLTEHTSTKLTPSLKPYLPQC
jgi:hypothetical protein